MQNEVKSRFHSLFAVELIITSNIASLQCKYEVSAPRIAQKKNFSRVNYGYMVIIAYSLRSTCQIWRYVDCQGKNIVRSEILTQKLATTPNMKSLLLE